MLCLVSGNESEAIIDVLPAGDSSEKSPSPVSEVINDVPLVATASVGAPPEPSGATAFPVKPYHPEIRKDTRMEMNMVSIFLPQCCSYHIHYNNCICFALPAILFLIIQLL